MQRHALTLMLAAMLCAAASAQETAKKPPAPDAAALKKASATLEEVFKAEFKAAVSNEQKLAMAQKVLESANDERDSALRFAIYCKVRDLAVEAGHYQMAAMAVEAIDLQYEIDAVKFYADAALGVAKVARTPAQKRMLATNVDPVVDAAMGADRYDLALPVAEAANQAARLAEDGDLTKRSTERYAFVRETAALYEKMKPHMSMLAKVPDEPISNFEVGQYKAFYKGKWEEGLPHLAKGNNPAIKAAAEAELKKPAKGDEQVAVADLWWDIAQKQTGGVKNQITAHAATIYRNAINDLSGLARVKVEKRLVDIAQVSPRDGRTVNLIKLLNNNSIVAGSWTLKDGVLTSGTDMGARIEFPYEPPEEYDFRVICSRASGDDGAAQILSAFGKTFCFSMGSKGNTKGGLEMVNGADIVNNKTGINLPMPEGAKVDAVVQIRKDSVRVLINGRLVVNWKKPTTPTSRSTMGGSSAPTKPSAWVRGAPASCFTKWK